jgi:hypothetical protein
LAWQGYTDVDEISRLSGVAPANVKRVFESRDTEIQHALRHGLDEWTAPIKCAIKCAGCNTMIVRVPCVYCRCQASRKKP